MKAYLDANQFNVAPGASRHPPMTWVMLAASAVVFGVCLYPLSHALGRLNDAKSAQAALIQAMRRDAAEQRKHLADQSNTAALEREKIKAQIQDSMRMSWDGVFDALEVAADTVHAGVSIISLAPAKVSASATQLNIAALAANVPIMLAYVDALKKDPRVSQVEITTQQPDEKVGPAVIRFRISVVLNPKITVAHAARESASAAISTGASLALPGPANLPPANAHPTPARR